MLGSHPSLLCVLRHSWHISTDKVRADAVTGDVIIALAPETLSNGFPLVQFIDGNLEGAKGSQFQKTVIVLMVIQFHTEFACWASRYVSNNVGYIQWREAQSLDFSATQLVFMEGGRPQTDTILNGFEVVSASQLKIMAPLAPMADATTTMAATTTAVDTDASVGQPLFFLDTTTNGRSTTTAVHAGSRSAAPSPRATTTTTTTGTTK
ncbi:hypothetical protein ACLKA6_010209 [Drosophila palustris]